MRGPVILYVVFYTLYLGDSRVLDYKQECKTICEEVGIKRENCSSREDALVDQVFKSRQEAENERERANRAEANLTMTNQKLGKVEAEKDSVTAVLLPYYAFVKSRGRVEHLERKFGLKYVSKMKLSPKTLKDNTKMYEYKYHLRTWEWIWENCDDTQFSVMKDAAIQEFGNNTMEAKRQLCTSYANVILGTSGSVHLPKRMLGVNVTSDAILKALEEYQGLDSNSIKCLKFVWL